MFEKGHKGYSNAGRKKGSKNKNTLIRYTPKYWEKAMSRKMYNIEEITYRLENNLPLDDYLDTLNKTKK